MKYFLETTEWDAGYAVPNHVYYMKDDRSKAVGYIPAGSNKLVKFKRPFTMITKGRKFTVLPRKGEPDEVYFPKTQKEPTTEGLIEVQGSSGKKYYLNKIGNKWSCSCPGYTFRRTCKHVADKNV